MILRKWSKTQSLQTESKNISEKSEKEDEMLGRDRDAGFVPAEKETAFSAANSSGGTILSNDAEFKGALTFKGNLRVDGKFEGEINSPGAVHIGPEGELKAEVNVGSSIVEGKVTGNITAQDRIELRSTAKLYGDIKASRLIINEGVIFVGKCEVNPSGGKIEMLRPEEKDYRKPVETKKTEIAANR
jgi:cytoskeletal protein CcmA (bactofilin family)